MDYKYIYGPVPSWRLGSSLGIDPISRGPKICSFDCVYCQIGRTGLLTGERGLFVECADVIREIESLPPLKIDYITFSGRGEPTLASNLGEMIRAVKGVRSEKIAVITNSSLLGLDDVQKELLPVDLVVAKLDAPSEGIFERVNRPVKWLNFREIVAGIKGFKERYKGKLSVQTMFLEGNRASAAELSQLIREIKPDEVQLNTPLRKCAAQPISAKEMEEIEGYFEGLKFISVYGADKKAVVPISSDDTLRRRGKT